MYLQTIAFLPLIFKANGKGTSLYIAGDGLHAVHAVHEEMKAMGKGAVYASSTKIKTNTVSFTEIEVTSVCEKLPKHVWFRKFVVVEQSGDSSHVHVIYQDNTSAFYKTMGDYL